jgi:tRNA-splicing ligase RtcB
MRVVETGGKRVLKIWTDEVEKTAMDQLVNLSHLPFIHPNGIAVMPDVHAGIGSTVGSVIATVNAIIPAAVGVDIGCGMMAVCTTLKAEDLPDSLSSLRTAIESKVPTGVGGSRDVMAHSIRDFNETHDYACLAAIGPASKMVPKADSQLGTLGSGNHFIELCLDQDGRVWLMLHSGSRGIGNMLGSYYITRAKELMERFHITLPDPALAYLPQGETLFDEYIEAMTWAQNYAAKNRELMMQAAIGELKACTREFVIINEAINCHHNYARLESHMGKNVYVTRKGAVSARKRELGIIPGSMGAKSFIVRGKGNIESYMSCSHGAGRKMSRSAAKKTFTVENLRQQTVGIECRKDDGVLDEIPSCYKDIDEVMAHQSDLVEIVHTLRQVMCIKGD